MTQLHVMLAAGGTGGHIFPALALADALQKQGHKVGLMTDKRGANLIRKQQVSDLPLYVISAASPFAGSAVTRLFALARLAVGFVQSLAILLVKQPAGVIGFGGYPSAPPLLAAKILKKPAALHEQNGRLGRANLWLANISGHLWLSWPDSTPLPKKARIIHTGLPVRADFNAIPAYKAEPKDRLNLLVIGGSLGAAIFATRLPEAITNLPAPIQKRLHITQQTRPEQIDEVSACYAETGIEADIAPFFTDMAERMAKADVIISRAGASSVAEIAAAGRPALFIPFAAALDDHQSANANQLASKAGALMLSEKEAQTEKLGDMLTALLDQPDLRQRLADKARTLHAAASLQTMTDLAVQLATSSNLKEAA